MIFSFLKLNKNRLPENSSLRSLIFNVNLYWSLILFVSILVFIVTAFLGFNLFMTLYREQYKKDNSSLNINEIFDVKRLEKNIKSREDFISTPREVPPDPSI